LRIIAFLPIKIKAANIKSHALNNFDHPSLILLSGKTKKNRPTGAIEGIHINYLSTFFKALEKKFIFEAVVF